MIQRWVLLIALGSLSSCAVLKQIAIDIAQCEAGRIPKDAQPLLPVVKEILAGDSVDWVSALEQLGIKAGIDLVKCAVAAVEFETTKGTRATLAPPSIAEMRTVARAQAYLAVKR